MKDQLLKFVSDDEMRPEFNSLFRVNEYVCATNSYVLAYMVSDIEAPEMQNKKNSEKIYNDLIKDKGDANVKEISVSAFDKWVNESCSFIEEKVKKGEDVKCKECSGSGQVEWEYKTYTKDDDCPICNGDGYEYQAPYFKTGKKKIQSYDNYFRFDDYVFDMYRFQDVFNVIKDLYIETIKFSTEDNKLYVKLDNGLNFMLMGCIKPLDSPDIKFII